MKIRNARLFRRMCFGFLGVCMLWTLGCTSSSDVEAPAADETYEALPAEVVEQARALRERALEGHGAYDFLSDLTTEVGPRLAGSAADRRAVAWARARLETMGFDVRTEEVTVPHWRRGLERGRILEPFPQPMVLTALGGSVATPREGLVAEVVEAASLEELENMNRGQLEGKIAFINQRMRRSHDGSGYGESVGGRSQGPWVAAERGAVALLIRSVGTSNHRIAHTGAMRHKDGQPPPIPAAALSNPDADVLEKQLAKGRPVRFLLELESERLPDEVSANVIAEIPGRELPQEVVLLVAHLDSWDLGTGAIDDGSGCAIVAEAARLIAELPTPPRRTVRVMLTANEEFGLSGARAYAERYRQDLGDHAAAFEADFGPGKVWMMRSLVREEALPVVRDLQTLLAPLGIEYGGNEARGGADLSPLRGTGVPIFDLRQDGTLYFDIHHTADDTLDKVDPESLAQNVAAYVTAAYVTAEIEASLGPAPASSPGS